MSQCVKVDWQCIDGRPHYSFSPIEWELAEREKIPHGCAYALVLKPSGKLLRVRRSPTLEAWPDCNSVPAGHMDVINGMPETPYETVLRELHEETKLRPRKVAPVLEDTLIYRAESAHVGFAFVCTVRQDASPKYDEQELVSGRSAFETPEIVLSRLQKEKFTPPSRLILEQFLQKYSTREALVELYKSF